MARGKYLNLEEARTVIRYAPDLADNVLTRPSGPAVLPSGFNNR